VTTREEIVREAGGVVFRHDDDGTPYFLVVQSSDRSSWLFPKGHIEKGETAEVAAVREVREEAGVETVVTAPLGNERFMLNGRDVDVEFYLLEFQSSVAAHEDRELRWCGYAEAAALLSFEAPKRALERAQAALDARS
jgi:8-oxo-dGTP pyrophosphatase MutT (NUDIX family)